MKIMKPTQKRNNQHYKNKENQESSKFETPKCKWNIQMPWWWLKSAPSTWCFNDFDFQIALARRRGANFGDILGSRSSAPARS